LAKEAAAQELREMVTKAETRHLGVLFQRAEGLALRQAEHQAQGDPGADVLGMAQEGWELQVKDLTAATLIRVALAVAVAARDHSQPQGMAAMEFQAQ